MTLRPEESQAPTDEGVMPDPALRRRMFLFRIGLSLALLLGAVGVVQLLIWTGPKPAPNQEEQALRSVEVFAAQMQDVGRQWHGYGTAWSMDSADVPAQVTATVVNIPADVLPGRSVTKGQLLVELDAGDFTHQVEIARQTLANFAAQLARLDIQGRSLAERLALDQERVDLASDELDRVEQITTSGAGSRQGLDRARRTLIQARRTKVETAEALDVLDPLRTQLEAQRDAQKAELLLAEANLARCRIVSPLDGVLQAVDVEVGEQLAVGWHVARVVNLQRMEVVLRLPAGARGQVAKNDAVTLHAGAEHERSWSAKVYRISPEDDSLTRTLTVYVEVERKPDHDLLTPGRFVSAVVSESTSRPRWVVPVRALRHGRIFVVVDGEVQSRAAKVDYMVEQEFTELGLGQTHWAVLNETNTKLAAGAMVVVKASGSVFAGDRVQPRLPGIKEVGP